MASELEEVFTPTKTSGQLLIDYARVRLLASNDEQNSDPSGTNVQRYLLLYDVYIKARAYSILNKVAAVGAAFTGAVALLGPWIFQSNTLLKTSAQTTVTALAAALFGVYSFYKKRQLFAENLMRGALFWEGSLPSLRKHIIREMERIDAGFHFAPADSQQSEHDIDQRQPDTSQPQSIMTHKAAR